MESLESILTKFGIPFRDQGKNVGSDDVNINCPFCNMDPSYHCGISRSTGVFHCWVCNASGSFRKLIVRLSQVYRNKELLRYYRMFNRGMYSPVKEKPIPESDLSKYYVPLNSHDPLAKPYIDYLLSRDVSLKRAQLVNVGMGLDKMYGRVVFPVKISRYNGIIGRSISDQKPKWKKLKATRHFPPVFGLHLITRNKFPFLFVCEGIFDILKLPIGSAIAILSKGFSRRAILEIFKVYRGDIVLALDNDTTTLDNLRWKEGFEELGFNVSIFQYRSGVKDFGELNMIEIMDMLDDYISSQYQRSLNDALALQSNT